MNGTTSSTAKEWLHRWGPVGVVVIAAAGLCSAMFIEPWGIRSGDAYRDNDWLSILFFSAWLHQAVTELGEFPLWCPYVGGGYPTVLHPSDTSLTPLAIPVLLLGPVWGTKLNLLGLTVAGGLGVWGLAREHLGQGRWPATVSAVAYVAAGWFPSMMLVGFYNLAIYHLVPPMLLFLVRGSERLRYAIPAGLLLGWIAFLGGTGSLTVALFTSLLTLGLAASRLVGTPRTAWRPLAVLGIAGGIALGVAAVKIDGVATLLERGEYSHAAERGEMAYGDIDWEAWTDHVYPDLATFLRSAVTHVPLEATYGEDGWPTTLEYAHLGLPLAVIVLLIPAWVAAGRRMAPWLLAGGAFLLLCFGPNSPLDLYRLLIWNVEPLRAISQFYKYGNYFVMLVAVLGAGAGLEPLLRRIGQPRGRALLIGVALGGLLVSLVGNALPLATLCRLPVPATRPDDNFLQVAASHNPLPELGENVYRERARRQELVELYNLRLGLGTIDWYADIYLPENAVAAIHIDPRTGEAQPNRAHAGEVTVVAGNGTVRSWDIGANRVDLTLALDGPATVVINQNHDPAWTSDVGEVVNAEGRLGLQLEGTGTQGVRLRYRPTRFFRGLAISGLVLAGSLGGWFALGLRERRRREERTDGPE